MLRPEGGSLNAFRPLFTGGDAPCPRRPRFRV